MISFTQHLSDLFGCSSGNRRLSLEFEENIALPQRKSPEKKPVKSSLTLPNPQLVNFNNEFTRAKSSRKLPLLKKHQSVKFINNKFKVTLVGDMFSSTQEFVPKVGNTELILSTFEKNDNKNRIIMKDSDLKLIYSMFLSTFDGKFFIANESKELRSKGLMIKLTRTKTVVFPVCFRISHFFIKLEEKTDMFVKVMVVDLLSAVKEEVVLPKNEEITIGRKNSEVVIPSKEVSKIHVKLKTNEDGEMTIENCSQRNSTWLLIGANSVQMDDGDLLKLGKNSCLCFIGENNQ